MTTRLPPNADFKRYLQEELLKRCRKNPKYSLRSFAKSLRIENSALSKILHGRRALTAQLQARLGERMGLGPAEMAKFAVPGPVRRGKKLTPVPATDFRQLTLDQFAVISDWYHYAILELTRIRGFKSEARWISRRLGISIHEAHAAIERLLKLNYLRRDERGNLVNVSGSHTTVGNAFTAVAFRKLQKQILTMAITKMEEVPIERRNQTSMTIAVDTRRLPEAIAMIADFRARMTQLLERSENLDEVYHLGICLYPVTQSIDVRDSKKKEPEV